MDSAFPKLTAQQGNVLNSLALARRTFAFLMLGGASLILMALCAWLSIPSVLIQDNVRIILQQVTGTTLFFLLIFSYQHFIWSYRFAYQQGLPFITRNSMQLIISPLVLFSLFVLSVVTWNQPVASVPPLLVVDSFFDKLGVELNWSRYEGCGQLLLASLLITQTIMSGHHYIMQAFGVALACGEKQGYRLTVKPKQALLLSLYCLWIMNMLSGYTFFSMLNTGSFAFHPTKFPQPLVWASYALAGISLIAVFVSIIFPALRARSKFPPFMALVPIISIWAWLQPFCQPFGFQFWVVPLAHGAQYLHFSYSVESQGFDDRFRTVTKLASRSLHYLIMFSITVFLGYAFFMWIPRTLDNAKLVSAAPNFFFLGAFIFISIHHYILDSVVWKKDSRAKQLLRNVVLVTDPVS